MNRQKSPQKKSSVAGLIAVLLVVGALAGNELDGEALVFVLPTIVVIAVLAVCFRFLFQKKAAGRTESAGGREGSPFHRQEESHRARPSFATRRPDPRSRSFVKPDAPCIVCENTGENHLERDKQNRIRQLDDWLKTGLIDRKEYYILKERYQRDL